ncbi:MAG: UshA-like (seleno)protein [Thermodesulfobacteriota bacterium]
MGGLSKRAYQIDKLRETGRPLLLVDGGGLLFKAATVAPDLAPQEKMAAQGLAEAYRLMRYDAVGITAQDLAAGLPFLQELAKQHKVPWLSADLTDRATGKPLFPASLTRKTGNLTIGIFALAGPAAAPALLPGDQAMVRPWQEVVPALLASLRKSADLILLLSGLPAAENEALARHYPGIHLIVQAGDEGATSQPPRQVHNTLLLQTEKQGKYMGVLDIRWGASGKWGEDRTRLLATKQGELDRVQWFIRSHQRKGDPAEIYRNAPGKLAAYQEFVAQEQSLHREIRRLQQEIVKGEGHSDALADHRLLALTTDLPDHPAVQALVEKTTRDMNRLGQELARAQLERNRAVTADPGPLVGWQRCADCHRTEADFWRQSRHARAYETLRAREQHFNQGCLPCHVTGPATTTLPAPLQAVGCESCHGPGRDHSADPKQPMIKRPPAQTCLGCHTPDQDDSFDYARDLLRLNCPGVRP